MPQKDWFGFTPSTDLPQLILTSLEESPKVAQELRNDIQGLSRIWLEPGALFRALRHLEHYGWIELHESEKENRHVYRLTHAGRLALRQCSVAFFENRERVQPQSFVDLHKEHILMIIITWILHLYPRAWRERYEPEMLALLEEHSITFFTGLDLLIGALDARIDPYYRRIGARSPHQRLQRARTATTVAFGALPLVFLASLFIDAHVNSTWWFTWSGTHLFFSSLMDRVSGFGGILWSVALLVALALVAYHGIKSGKRKDRILSVLSLGSVVVTFLAFLTASAKMIARKQFLLPDKKSSLEKVCQKVFQSPSGL